MPLGGITLRMLRTTTMQITYYVTNSTVMRRTVFTTSRTRYVCVCMCEGVCVCVCGYVDSVNACALLLTCHLTYRLGKST